MERLDRFMARANAAYYALHDPFRDFTTAPEVSQVFGELLGAWAAVVWETLGRPAPVLLAEAGPGRGTAMSDALRAVAQVAPAFRAALRLHLIEASPRLRELQQERLPSAVWHEGLETLPPDPLILLANEFLDALPVRQWVRRGDAWFERFVADGAFAELAVEKPISLSRWQAWAAERTKGGVGVVGSESQNVDPAAPPSPLPLPPAGEGDLVECSEAAHGFVAALASRFRTIPGAALFLDYGPFESAAGQTLQAIREGCPADPLRDPGSADLTAHVDFAGLARTAKEAGAAVYGPIPQGMFLARLGLHQRTDRLARNQPPAKAAALIAAAQRLAEPANMGLLFKAFVICHPSLPTPPGFAE